MALLQSRRLIRAIILPGILLPLVSFAQVTIKEKVEIKPKQATVPKRLASQFDFFSPPLFINTVDGIGLTLASSLTLSGTVSINGQISPGHFANLVWQEQEQPIGGWVPDGQLLAWKGVSPDGQPYGDETPKTGIFNQIDRPVINLYTFDDQFWGRGGREIAVGANGLAYTFSGAILEGPRQLPVPVSATATATGSFLESAKFHSWYISAYPVDVTCGEASRVSFVPLDGSGSSYEPFGVELMSSTITLSVQANGDYAFLRCGSQEGKQITIPYPTSDPCDLVLDTYRGDIPGDHDIATVTIDGGGASASVSINLMCTARNGVDHLSIEANPRSLPYGGISILTVKALDEHNQEVTPPADFNVDLSAYVTDDMYMSVRGSAVPGKSLTTFRKKPFAITQGKHPLLPHPQSYSGSFSVDGGKPEGDWLTVPYSVAKQGRVAYVADGLDYGMPTRDSTHVAIGVAMTDAWWETYGETNVVVKKSNCAKVRFTKSILSPGETTTLEFKKEDGSPFDASTEFDVAILGGGSNPGSLSSSSGSGTSLTKTKAPVTYVAPATIEGDSLVVQVAAFAYNPVAGGVSVGSGGGDALSVLANGSSLEKKAPRRAAAQTMALNSDRAVLERIWKLVANNVCSAGEAVVRQQKYPPCEERVDYSGVTSTPETKGPPEYDNCDGISDLGGTRLILHQIEPVICDAGGGCLRARISSIEAEIKWGYCSNILASLGAPVDSYTSIPKNDIAKGTAMVRALNSQIQRLDEIIYEYQQAEGSTEYIGERPVRNNGYYSLRGILAHERAHRDSTYSRIEQAVEEVSKMNSQCLPASSPASELKQKLNSLRSQFVSKELELDRTKKNSRELGAHRAGRDHLVALVRSIKDYFGIS